MHINQLPTEILGLVIGSLAEEADSKGGNLPEDHHEIANARLVCRKWNKLAIPHLFQTITLVHHDVPLILSDEDEPGDEGKEEADGGFGPWNNMVDSEEIQKAAQYAVIRTTPESLSKNAYWDVWQEWQDNGEYPKFTHAINRITELKNLRMLHLLFSERCLGEMDEFNPEAWDGWNDDIEPLGSRLATLRAVFNAMINRAADADAAKVRWLRLHNVQNTSLDSLVVPEMAGIIKDLTRLDLIVRVQRASGGPDNELNYKERRLFEPHLQRDILPNFLNSLTTLTLGFRERWGTAPGYFDGEGLIFPHLKTLNLLNFVISHHDHFDWVLAQTSLTTLRLYTCAIVSYISITEDDLALWGTPTHDWERFPDRAFGFPPGCRIYKFAGTWETVFNKIHASLTKLTDLRFDCTCFHADPFLETMQAELSGSRYIVLDAVRGTSPWIPSGYYTGAMSFGNNNPTPVTQDREIDESTNKCDLNVAKEVESLDSGAFNSLLYTIRKRRQGWGR